MKARKIVRNRRKIDEKGVSPVIGVILMVAATIVIAAVVLAMLGGFTPPKRTYTISLTATQEGDDIIVTYNGGPDQDLVSKLIFSGTKSDASSISWTKKVGGSAGTFHTTNNTLVNPEVGDQIIAEGAGTPGRDHIVVTAVFKDGTKQVVLDTYV